MNPLEEAAREYIRLGLRTLALTGKTPNTAVHRTWSHENSIHGLTDILTFRDAFRHPATTGVGILTGPTYYVVDIDGEEGARVWRDLVGDADFMPDRWVARTGRGLHLWYADYRMWRTTKLGTKLDFKGYGGYVAAPPSQHPDGPIYEWLLPPTADEPPREFPEGLFTALGTGNWSVERSKVKRVERRITRDAGMLMPTTNFDGILERMKAAEPGERNNVLNWAAYTMIGDGADDEDLQVLAQTALDAGLDRHEIERTIGSALATR